MLSLGKSKISVVRALPGFCLSLVLGLATLSCAASPKKYDKSLNGVKGSFEIIRSDYGPGEIKKLCSESIANFEKALDLSKDAYEMDKALSDLSDQTDPLTFMSYVSMSPGLRDEASACEEDQGKLMVKVFTRRDLYEKVKNTKAKQADDAYYLKEFVRSFEQNGMALSDADLAKFKKMKEDLTSLETQFSKNLNEDVSTVEFSEADLKGVPEGFLKRLKKSTGGDYIVTTKTTDLLQVMENAENPMTRKKMLLAYDNRAGIPNSKLLKEAVELRAKIATLLGYKTWADYRIDGRMAKNSKNAADLLGGLKVKLQPRLKKDFDRLLVSKQKLEDPKAKQLTAWDLRYFSNQVKKKDYSLDDEYLREYFPKDHVMSEMFKIYETLLNVKFEEIKDASVWHPEVKLYATKDAKSGEVLSYFYVDAFPREGKYGHAAAFSLIRGRDAADGTYSKPVSSIVSNFTPPANGKPSLMTHDEVETLFHEFGHIMHQTLTRGPYGTASGTAVARDFVEAPSQMLENWVWNKKILQKVSGHYSDTSKKLPNKTIDQLVRSKDFNQGYFYSRQIVLGTTDLQLHMNPTVDDVNKVYADVQKSILGIDPVEGSHWMAGFGHLMGGYDAGYYGYIWSEVYAADMFTAFKKGGLLSPKVGKRYREFILEPGGMVDPYILITKFLGRKPNDQAFLKKLGLN